MQFKLLKTFSVESKNDLHILQNRTNEKLFFITKELGTICDIKLSTWQKRCKKFLKLGYTLKSSLNNFYEQQHGLVDVKEQWLLDANYLKIFLDNEKGREQVKQLFTFLGIHLPSVMKECIEKRKKSKVRSVRLNKNASLSSEAGSVPSHYSSDEKLTSPSLNKKEEEKIIVSSSDPSPNGELKYSSSSSSHEYGQSSEFSLFTNLFKQLEQRLVLPNCNQLSEHNKLDLEERKLKKRKLELELEEQTLNNRRLGLEVDEKEIAFYKQGKTMFSDNPHIVNTCTMQIESIYNHGPQGDKIEKNATKYCPDISTLCKVPRDWASNSIYASVIQYRKKNSCGVQKTQQ